MSAVSKGQVDGAPTGKRRFAFAQEVPIPSYLVAIAVGELHGIPVGPRSTVWAEPSVVEKAAWEFAECEKYLQAGEALTGCPYVWKKYDVLCMPPSFPYGGMENPCLTFATPTLLAGDRSLANVIAHEIAHSWTGNNVTNHTWEHFWLNEVGHNLWHHPLHTPPTPPLPLLPFLSSRPSHPSRPSRPSPPACPPVTPLPPHTACPFPPGRGGRVGSRIAFSPSVRGPAARPSTTSRCRRARRSSRTPSPLSAARARSRRSCRSSRG